MFNSAEQANQISARIEMGTVNPGLTQRDELLWDHFQVDSIPFG